MNKRIVVTLIFLCFILCRFLYAEITPLKVTFIDVGHGDSILIHTPDDGIKGNGKYEGKIILIDGGKSIKGKKVVIPYLKLHDITEEVPIDFLIMTHAHSSHAGGLIHVIQAYKVKVIIDPGYAEKTRLYKSFCKLAGKEPGCKFYKPLVGTLINKEGDKLNWGSELEVKVLNSEQEAEDANSSSIVIWFKYKDISFLFSGDIEGKDTENSPDVLKYLEKDLLEEYADRLKSTFLKVPHHGTEDASTNAFINAVSPRYAIICAGDDRLADESVIKRYEDRGIKIYRTDRNETSGDDHIIITTDGTLKGTKIGYEGEAE